MCASSQNPSRINKRSHGAAPLQPNETRILRSPSTPNWSVLHRRTNPKAKRPPIPQQILAGRNSKGCGFLRLRPGKGFAEGKTTQRRHQHAQDARGPVVAKAEAHSGPKTPFSMSLQPRKEKKFTFFFHLTTLEGTNLALPRIWSKILTR